MITLRAVLVVVVVDQSMDVLGTSFWGVCYKGTITGGQEQDLRLIHTHTHVHTDPSDFH